ncbi:MAG: hypothetical protein COU83_00240 [Candidatus Portnoybacteria bacterium CG10_big_fil_rev_8_21_14_0_10_40_22]|uniref:TRCF n=2 Tax=Candidatus Portnoyibacteriota TaxID=1817913 RepID=A0A2M8KGZ5_9BACT|nr:MAG: hypothetical protein COU83_00240 [Candidatus Portnoybacteria bacterium CG10_big_fil_rev_8_21_14_0_10_40_22]
MLPDKDIMKYLIIPRLTPYFLSKPVLWFRENRPQLKNLAKKPWAKNQVLILDQNQIINPLNLLRQLAELGYQKTQRTAAPGQFSHRGSVIDIFALGHNHPWRLDFIGNCLEQIITLSVKENSPDDWTALINRRVNKRKTPIENTVKHGDYLVHLDHGIGRFIGFKNEPTRNSQPATHDSQLAPLKKTLLTGRTTRYFVIEYAQKDKLFVPVELSDKLNLYFGFNRPTVHRLGGTLWSKIKKRVSQDTINLAKELLKIYAERETSPGFVYESDNAQSQELADDFPYQETADQKQTLTEIIMDMESPYKMDRLVCGDVGFGKTEIALRAVFKAVMSSKQVAILAPTTILANQHYHNFKKRLGRFAINVAMLSRLQNKHTQKNIINQIGQGQTDIIIGTHRLLSKDIQFKNIGLVIIDEEQRFGVRQKEKFKKTRANIDVLSLSATPIPRTLYLSLSNLREVSLIQTPPPGRLPIKTFIQKYDCQTIKKAILQEFDRGGQVYFLHNRVQTIDLVRQKLSAILGHQAKIGIIHGRLPENELINTMNKFRNREINLLLATTIIENGLDLPNANTLIVEDATRLGLSQAYQIRGRIGRSTTQAYAYFLYRPKNLTDIAQRRLKALQEAETLGSGYEIAKRDLEIRGAGNILGREQAGHINAVGLNLYCQMINEAVRQLKNQS